MRISHFLAGGLFLALLAIGLEARPAARPQQKPARSASGHGHGHELAEVPAAGSERGEAAGGGGRARGSRLLRELRVDTRSRAAWARLLRDPPGPRRHKAGKKGLSLSKGCFGLKLDRIGSMSGLGC